MNATALTARHAELVAAREQNAARIRELRQAITQAERDDYAFAAVIGELERLLAQPATPAPAAAPKRRRGRA